MSKTYSLCAVFNRDEARGMLRALAPFLAPVSRERFGELDWEPVVQERRRLRIGVEGVDAYGIAGMEIEELETENSFAISLAVELEPELRLGLKTGIEVNGLVHIGPMWLSVYGGEKFALLELTSTTPAVSEALEKSEVFAYRWRDYGERSQALLVYEDLSELREGYEKRRSFPWGTSWNSPGQEASFLKTARVLALIITSISLDIEPRDTPA